MSRYLNEVRRHAEKIKHLHENAGELGYDNALYHFQQIDHLEVGATRSVQYKNDAPLIQEIKKSMQKLMDEMERRKVSKDAKKP